MIRLQEDGTFSWGAGYGYWGTDPGWDHAKCLSLIGPDILFGGSLDHWIHFNPEPGSQVLSYGDGVGFVLRLGASGVGMDEGATQNTSPHIYPNPCNGSFLISIPLRSRQPLELSFSDTQGRVLDQRSIIEASTTIQTSLPDGLYYLSITADNRILTQQQLVIMR